MVHAHDRLVLRQLDRGYFSVSAALCSLGGFGSSLHHRRAHDPRRPFGRGRGREDRSGIQVPAHSRGGYVYGCVVRRIYHCGIRFGEGFLGERYHRGGDVWNLHRWIAAWEEVWHEIGRQGDHPGGMYSYRDWVRNIFDSITGRLVTRDW